MNNLPQITGEQFEQITKENLVVNWATSQMKNI